MRTKNARSQSNSGFTLLEMIVCVAIMAIVVGAAVPVTSKVLSYKARNATREELEYLSGACADYFQDVGSFPASLEALIVQPSPKIAPSWAGPYLPGVVTDKITNKPGYLVDAWSRAYTLKATGDVLRIRSLGEDATADSDDDIWIELDVTWIRREKTLERRDTLNRAIGLYNPLYMNTDPLPVNFTTARKKLVAAKLLPDDAVYATDAWGDAFVVDPAGKLPVVRVESIHLNGVANAAKKGKSKP